MHEVGGPERFVLGCFLAYCGVWVQWGCSRVAGFGACGWESGGGEMLGVFGREGAVGEWVGVELRSRGAGAG